MRGLFGQGVPTEKLGREKAEGRAKKRLAGSFRAFRRRLDKSMQKMFVLDIAGYVYLIPFTETNEGYFLKTIFPSRKATKEYLQ
ncbi:MAG TPA: hypothetical protein DE315_01530 [Candidatus Omnitrophica bacterium]|nr:hypothetical protein [Candidatus Omnitrophota bacterium]HCI44201.1 hypothetical protein [Candidatus Omnitrophota bacterium]